METLSTVANQQFLLVCLSQQVHQLINNSGLIHEHSRIPLSMWYQIVLFQNIVNYICLLLKQPVGIVNKTCILLLYIQLTSLLRPKCKQNSKSKIRVKRYIENYNKLYDLKTKLLKTLQLVGTEKVYNSQHLMNIPSVPEIQVKQTDILSLFKIYHNIVNGQKANADYVKLLRKQITAHIETFQSESLLSILHTNKSNIEGECTSLNLERFSL